MLATPPADCLRGLLVGLLPFINMSGDSEQEYFSDGISEDIITALSKLRWFFVIARNSSFIYKGKPVHMKQVAEELGVGYLVEGSVRKGGDRVRITAQLNDVATGSHIWAERYDRSLADVFAVQDEITEAIVAAIEPQLYAAENFRAKRKPPESMDAWDLVMRALSHYWRVTRQDNLVAQALLEKATALNSVASIASVFTTLLHRDFFEWLAQVRGRFWTEKKGKKARPILLDIETHKRSLARLFEVRNILVHEFPEKLPFILSEIDHLMETTSAFMNAADDGFTALLYGPYHHLSQHDMTMAARKESTAVEKALKKLVNEVAQATDTDTMKKAHDAWRAFAKADAERHAAPWTGGTAHPMMYWIAYRVLASDRLRQLQEWYGHFKDDMEMGRRLTPTSA